MKKSRIEGDTNLMETTQTIDSTGVIATPTPVRNITEDKVADIVLEIWRLKQRLIREGASERAISAVDRVNEKLQRIGFTTDTMQDRVYSENLTVKVIEHVDDDCQIGIVECLSPAVYFDGTLIRLAEVVTKGRNR